MKLSLKTKTVLLLIAIMVVLSGTTILVGSRRIGSILETHYSADAKELAYTVSKSLDVDKATELSNAVLEIYNSAEKKVTSDEWGSREFYQYVGLYTDIKELDCYKELYEQVRAIQDVNDVDCVYVYTVIHDERVGVYMLDADPEEPCPIGCIDTIVDNNDAIFDDPAAECDPYVTNTESYGWLVSCMAPVIDKDGNVPCYIGVDISMDEVRGSQIRYVAALVILLVSISLILCAISILLVNRTIVKPINILSEAAVKYCKGEKTGARLGFAAIDIHTGDEIEALSESMKQMERDINDNIANLLEASKELTDTKERAQRMNELAYKDALTGVRNKTSYDIEIMRLKNELADGHTKFGIVMIDLNYLKRINDSYGHENGNIAIIKLCNIICAIFQHSPVFRVGGDEFVVILKNTDYDKVRSLVTTFNTTIDEVSMDMSINPWERVSAAIGYAIYDVNHDLNVEDVFKRADKAMYARKKEMKSIRV
ncbi:MAG: diguanylate cyclase [Lachnospiraceae bacterium]|nr:diguanylate cyclase [Lachnospiraceae bacterium]